jgi:hypothetical protein
MSRTPRRSSPALRPSPLGRRHRPLGISIAVLATTLFYGLYPLVYVYPAVWSFFARRNIGEMFGVDFIGGVWGIAGLGLAGLVLVASVFVWRGRPPGARLMYIVLVWCAAGTQLARQIPALNPPPAGLATVGTNLQVPIAWYVCLALFNFAIPLYVTWYLNRAPARAFFAPATS